MSNLEYPISNQDLQIAIEFASKMSEFGSFDNVAVWKKHRDKLMEIQIKRAMIVKLKEEC